LKGPDRHQLAAASRWRSGISASARSSNKVFCNQERTDATYGLADYYGFKTGELITDDQRNVTRCASTVRMNWTGC
jgi:hypothetical protein